MSVKLRPKRGVSQENQLTLPRNASHRARVEQYLTPIAVV